MNILLLPGVDGQPNSKQVGIWIKELDKKEGIITVMEAKLLVKQRGKKRRKCCSFGMVWYMYM
tara:strand:+ start:303 stop:491 length:189 start_codon:yes stop_codon:yes gene_type:complete